MPTEGFENQGSSVPCADLSNCRATYHLLPKPEMRRHCCPRRTLRLVRVPVFANRNGRMLQCYTKSQMENYSSQKLSEVLISLHSSDVYRYRTTGWRWRLCKNREQGISDEGETPITRREVNAQPPRPRNVIIWHFGLMEKNGLWVEYGFEASLWHFTQQSAE